MLSIFTFIIVLSALIFIHELGHFLVAKKSGVKVEVFSLGFGRKLFKFKRKGTEYCLSAVPLGGYVKMAGETPYEDNITGAKWEFASKPVSVRALIIAAGPLLNYAMGFLLFTAVFLAGNPEVTSKVGGIMEGFPAESAGIKAGDRIVELDGRAVTKWEEILRIVHAKTDGKPVSVKVQRGERAVSFMITPEVKKVKNVFGQDVKAGLMGITASDELARVKYPFHEAVILSGRRVWELTELTYRALWRIITGGMSLRDSITGPVGIFMVTSEAARMGFVYVMGFTAVLSVCLAIFNLLPIPVLDGGHILFLAIEKIKGRAVDAKVYERVSRAGMTLLIALMLFVFYSDFVRFKIFDKIAGGFNRVRGAWQEK